MGKIKNARKPKKPKTIMSPNDPRIKARKL